MGQTVIDFLKFTAQKFPNKIACIDDQEECTYEQLWCESDLIAANLCKYIQLGSPVPIFMKKSCETLKLLWGVIKAGGCYCVIDPSFPSTRVHSMLETLGTEYIVCSSKANEKKLPESIKKIEYEELCVCSDSNSDYIMRKDRIYDTLPIYIMFTSGSTGVPKGVVVAHGAVSNFISEFTHDFNISETDIIGNQAPWDFDVSVKDIFSAAKVGATLRIIHKKYFSLPMDLAKLLEDSKVTVLIWAVSALCILSSSGVLARSKPSKIQKIIFSGEVMPIKQLITWKKIYPDALFVNVYGPTEITCNCTYYVVPDIDETSVLPIGKPFHGENVFLLDEHDEVISDNNVNIMGEVCVAGNNLALGYYANPKETNLHFVQNPNNKFYRDIIYRTGDLAYYNKERNLCYSGRKDFQIKHMGHRIELMEIEGYMETHANITNSRCVYFNNEIWAVYTGDIESKEVEKYLRKKLPPFMIPSKYIKKMSMPYNSHGKIDRNVLKQEIERGEY